MNTSIHYSETIFNMLSKINLTKQLSDIALKHIMTILITIFSIGYRGKTVDFERNSNNHRTTAGFDGFDYAGIKNYYDYKMINNAKGAEEAGVDFIAITYGFGFSSDEEAKQYNCVASFGDVDSLCDSLT